MLGDISGEAKPVKVQRIYIPYGNEGIMVSARKMVELIDKFSADQENIRWTAEDITRGCASKDYACNAEKVYWWVRRNVKWERDPEGREMIRSPIVTLNRRIGDCDDHAILIASLLRSIGMPVRIVLVATRRWKPKNFNHVFVETQIDIPNHETKRIEPVWLAIDTTPLNQNGKYFPFGVRPPGFLFKEMEVR